MKKILSLLAISTLLIPALASAHGPSRQKVEETITISASPDKVWAMVGDFGGLHNWHPAVVSTELKGDKERVLTIGEAGGPTITESLKKHDDGKMMMMYKIDAMSVVKNVDYRGESFEVPTLPVHNYLSTLKVTPVDGGSEVSWTGKFYRVYQLNYDKSEPRYPEGLGDAEAVETITNVYKSGLENLKKLVEGS